MKFTTAISILAASILALSSATSYAGKGQGQGGAAASQTQQSNRARSHDQRRTQDRATNERSQQNRERSNAPANVRNQDIYGNALMSDAERNQYRKDLGDSGTQASREQFQAQHEVKMRERAQQQGQDLVPPGQGPVYGGELMSVQERNEYREQLRHIDSDQDREKFQAQHRDRIEQRANALEIEVEDAE